MNWLVLARYQDWLAFERTHDGRTHGRSRGRAMTDSRRTPQRRRIHDGPTTNAWRTPTPTGLRRPTVDPHEGCHDGPATGLSWSPRRRKSHRPQATASKEQCIERKTIDNRRWPRKNHAWTDEKPSTTGDGQQKQQHIHGRNAIDHTGDSQQRATRRGAKNHRRQATATKSHASMNEKPSATGDSQQKVTR